MYHVTDHRARIVSQRPNITDQEKLIKKLIGADFGMFAATWWPFESLEVLQIMVQTVVWLFLWDDEIDCHDSRYGNDFDPAQTYREYTLAFVAQSLGLSTSPIEMNEHHPDHSTNFLITSFQSIADAIAHRDEAHRTRLYHEIEYFIRATETEQQQRLHADLASVEEYMKYRMGTSAVYVLFALLEMPVGLLKDTTVSSEMRKIESEANVIISISNDMFSLKKELAAGTPDSLIPILWQSNKSLSDAMATAMEMLYEARERFDEAETRLRRACPSSSMSDIEQFLTIAKTNCTGNIFWR